MSRTSDFIYKNHNYTAYFPIYFIYDIFFYYMETCKLYIQFLLIASTFSSLAGGPIKLYSYVLIQDIRITAMCVFWSKILLEKLMEVIRLPELLTGARN